MIFESAHAHSFFFQIDVLVSGADSARTYVSGYADSARTYVSGCGDSPRTYVSGYGDVYRRPVSCNKSGGGDPPTFIAWPCSLGADILTLSKTAQLQGDNAQAGNIGSTK